MLDYKAMARWSVCAAIMAALVSPESLSAQEYKYTNAGRIRHGLHKSLTPIHPEVGKSDWAVGNRAAKFWYPQDEWNSGSLAIQYVSGVLEEVLRSVDGSPAVRGMYNLWGGWSGSTNGSEAFDEIRRTRPPIVLSGVDEIDIKGGVWSGVVDPNLPTDQAVQLRLVYRDGFTLVVTQQANENPNIDRVLIQDWKLDYDRRSSITGGSEGDSTIHIPPGQVLNFWWGYQLGLVDARSATLWTGAGNKWGLKSQDDMVDVMEGPSRYISDYGSIPRAQKLQIAYYRDAKTDLLNDWDGSPLDDTGDPLVGPEYAGSPDVESGEFVGDKIIGAVWYHFDRSGADKGDLFHPTDLSQSAPRTLIKVQTRESIWMGYRPMGGDQGRYNLYTGTGFHKSPLREYFESIGINTNTAGGWTGVTEGTLTDAPGLPRDKAALGGIFMHYQASDYFINPTEEHHNVFVLAAANLPRAENAAYGQRYLKWLASQKPGLHPRGDALPAEIVPLSDLEKFNIIESVKDTLFDVVDKGFTAWHGGPNSGLTTQQKVAGMGLARMPNAPPAPDLLVRGGPRRGEIFAWYPNEAMFEDVDTGVDDFAGWRIYRKQGRPDVNHPLELESRGIQDWYLVGEVTAAGAVDGSGNAAGGTKPLAADHYNSEFTFLNGTTRRVMQFYDNSVSVGTDYFYAVAAFDDGSQNFYGFEPGTSTEGDHIQAATASNGTGDAAKPFTPGLQASDQVLVAPNPWSLDLGAGTLNTADQNDIQFARLPRICTLKIFTETGDLVKTIEHTNQSAEEIWNQRTISEQIVKSGIYILAVLNAKEVDPITNEIVGNLPDNFVKFVIIR